MKLTSVSSNNIKSEKRTEKAVIPPVTTGPKLANININKVSTITIMWPPIMLAKRRTVRAAGLVNMPKISIMGMMGRGNFSHRGTSGHNISFQ